MTCVNCGTEVSSKFCPECGQKVLVKRITFREAWYDFWARIYGFDGMFPRTLRDLTLRPGVASRSFIGGNRTLYYGPVGYFFLMITVVLLVMSLVDVDLVKFLSSGHGLSPMHPKVNSNSNSLVSTVLGFVSNNIKVLSFLIIPIQAFCARYLFFRKNGFNYLENSILPFYIQGHLYWLTIIVIIDYRFLGDVIPNIVFVIISVCFFGYAYSNFITKQPRWKAFLKGVGVLFTAQIMFMIIIALGIALFMLIDPDFYQMIKPSGVK